MSVRYQLWVLLSRRYPRIFEQQSANAIYSAFPSPSSLISANPYAFAANLIQSSISAYVNYQKVKAELALQTEIKNWELDKEKLKYINDLHKELLDAHWRITQKYNLPDSWRITPQEATEFIDRMKDTDIRRRYDYLAGNKEKYDKFPIFWYYMGVAASQMNKAEEALESFDKFDKENRPILRKDKILVSVEINRASILLNKQASSSKIIKSLKRIEANTDELDPTTWETLYFCALAYARIGEYDEAARVLRKNIDTLTFTLEKGALLDFQTLIERKKDILPTMPGTDSIAVNRMLLAEVAKHNSDNKLKDELAMACKNDTISNEEALYYVSRVRDTDILKRIMPDLQNIALEINPRWGRTDQFIAKVPVRWFFINGMKVSLKFYSDKSLRITADELPDARKADPVSKQVSLIFKVNGKLIANEHITTVDLVLQHPYCPVIIHFTTTEISKGSEPLHWWQNNIIPMEGYEFNGEYHKNANK